MTQTISSNSGRFLQATLNSASRIAVDVATQHATQAATRLLFGPERRITAGRSLNEIRLLTAGEGGGVPRVYGRGRVGGQIIWASEVREETETVSSTRGAKGVQRATESQYTEYTYFVSLAVALCEGEVARIGRVWADAKPITLENYNYRLYRGTTDQQADTLIESTEGSAPSYPGIAYIVFEDLPLAPFGNRVPQFNFEVERPLRRDDPHQLENLIRAVTIIPGSGETVYATEAMSEASDEGVTRGLNRHNGLGVPDFIASLDALEGTLPAVSSSSLVVSWFGNDLRAGYCQVRPGVERRDRVIEPTPWSVAGYDSNTAYLLSETNGRPSYGGTPSDESVRQAIRDLKDRDHAVMLHPFILMDIGASNGLPDPYGDLQQAVFPWRGRITANSLSDDKTASVQAQVNAFFDEFDSMVLHYASLAADEGGVDAIVLGSELRGMTRLRDHLGNFPAVTRLKALAAQVRSILPDAKISYGADWSEYFGYQPSDGSGDVLYPLDAFWADQNVDFVGIDQYAPLTDWRDGDDHLDLSIGKGPYDLDYLQSRIAGGEGFDWYYASSADRFAQVRTPISDGAYGDDWTFKPKDFQSWWSNTHTERVGGVKTSATAWVPQSKPIWFTELGCAAIDKGANQPNVFVDPKSSESAVPYFSSGVRDDRSQRSCLEAYHLYWDNPANNPVSSVYGQPMVATDRFYVYAWDARPFPDFPARSDVWADAENWVTGHWLNGRAGRIHLSTLIETLAEEAGLSACDASACTELLSGMTIAEPAPVREALEPLFDLYQLSCRSRDGVLIVEPRTGAAVAQIDEGDLVDDGEAAPLRLHRLQDDEIPNALSITFQDELSGYAVKSVEVRDETGRNDRTQRIGTAVVLEQGEAAARASSILAEAKVMNVEATFGLPNVADGLEPADTVLVNTDDQTFRFRITEIYDGVFRKIKAVSTDPGVFVSAYHGLSADPPPVPPTYGGVVFEALDIPLLPEGEEAAHLWLASFADPWPGRVLVYRGEGADLLEAQLSAQSLIGRLTETLSPGPVGRWDRRSVLAVRLPAGGLSSVAERDVLNGAHLCAVETSAGWEVLQFASASLQPDGSWHLKELLRGRRGTEVEAAAGAASGARFVLLSQATPLPLAPDRWGRTETFEAGPLGADPGAYPFRAFSAQLKGTGARPLAPVHLQSVPEGGGHRVTWLRRTRLGGDQWGEGDVPLGETAEAYQATLYNSGGAVIDTLATTIPEALITHPDAAKVEVAQISTTYGPGRSATLAL